MLCLGGLGVEAAYMIEEGYALPAMLATGLPETVASAMWAVGPVVGVLFQGYLGSASDRCTCAWGKRRPFIVCLAVCACLATLLFPYGAYLSGTVLGLNEKSGAIFVMVFTALTFICMDFFLDALQSPLRAYLIDSVPTQRSEQSNYIYTALLCVGAVMGSLFAGIPWTSLGGNREESANRQLEIVYGIATAMLVVCMLLCLNSIRERNPSTHESPCIERQLSLPLMTKRKTVLFEKLANDFSQFTFKPQSRVMSKDDLNHKLKPQMTISNGNNHFAGKPRPLRTPPLLLNKSNATTTTTTATLLEKCTGCLRHFFRNIYEDLCGTVLFSKYMSPHFSHLCLTIFLSWASYLSMSLFFTSFVGQVVYGGSPHTDNREKKELFDYGVRVAFLVMLFQDVGSTLSCLSMKWLSNLFGIRKLFVGGLAAYAAVCCVTALQPTLINTMVLQAMSGLVYSNMQSHPYTLISHYEVGHTHTHTLTLQNSDFET